MGYLRALHGTNEFNGGYGEEAVYEGMQARRKRPVHFTSDEGADQVNVRLLRSNEDAGAEFDGEVELVLEELPRKLLPVLVVATSAPTGVGALRRIAVVTELVAELEPLWAEDSPVPHRGGRGFVQVCFGVFLLLQVNNVVVVVVVGGGVSAAVAAALSSGFRHVAIPCRGRGLLLSFHAAEAASTPRGTRGLGRASRSTNGVFVRGGNEGGRLGIVIAVAKA
jgi:hypothetical protein